MHEDPHGPVLGPLIFIVCTNDLSNYVLLNLFYLQMTPLLCTLEVTKQDNTAKTIKVKAVDLFLANNLMLNKKQISVIAVSFY